MNEEFLKQTIADLTATHKAELHQTEQAFGTTIIILTLALSDHIDLEKLKASILNGVAVAQKHDLLNTTARQLLAEMVSALEEKQQATPHQGQAKH